MAFHIAFSEEKNQLRKATRGVCFDDALEAIKDGQLLADISHPNTKRSHQKILVVIINGYVYVVPYVKDEEKHEFFLKTVYPSRVLTKKYMKGKRK